MGNSIAHSANSGGGRCPKDSRKRLFSEATVALNFELRTAFAGIPFAVLLATTHPQNPKPLPYGFAEILSAEFDAPRVVAERVEVFKDALDAPAFEHRRVFREDVFRLDFPDDAGHFAPEPASFAADSNGFRIR